LAGDFFIGERINVLVFGIMGAGKSSFINCVAHSLSATQDVSGPAETGKSPSHVTTMYNLYNLGDYLQKKSEENKALPLDKFTFNFYDTWGVTTKTWDLESVFNLEACLQGYVKSPYELAKVDDFANKKQQYDVEVADLKISEEDRVAHVLLVIVPRAFPNEEDDLKQRLRMNVSKATNMGYSPIVIVTRMDEQDKISNTETELSLKQVFTDLTGVPTSNIYLHCNYTTQTRRDPEIDFNTRRILLGIKESGRSYKSKIKSRKDSGGWGQSIAQPIKVEFFKRARSGEITSQLVTQISPNENLKVCLIKLFNSQDFQFPKSVVFSIGILDSSSGKVSELSSSQLEESYSKVFQRGSPILYSFGVNDTVKISSVEESWIVEAVRKKQIINEDGW